MGAINPRDLYLAFGTDILNTDYRTFNWAENQDQVDANAGADTEEESIGDIIRYRASVDVVIQAGDDESNYVAGQESSIEIGREGTASGKPKITATTARVESFSERLAVGDVGIWTVAWRIFGITRGTYT